RRRLRAAPRTPIEPVRNPATWTIPCATAPAAMAAAAMAVALVACGYAGPSAGFAALAAGGALLGRAVARGRGAVPVVALAGWTGFAIAFGVRGVAVVGGAGIDADAWSRAAAEGGTFPVAGGLRLEAVRALRAGQWSVRGRLDGCTRPCAGAEARFVWRGDSAPVAGERWLVSGRLRPEPLRSPPGSRYPPAGLGPAARSGALEDPRLLERGRAPKGPATAFEAWIRGRLAARYGPDLAPLAVALVLGDRRGIDPALTDAFTLTGTLHLLAVSGLHVGFMAALLAIGLSLARLSPSARAAWTTVALASYAGLVGGRPSVVRAAAMASLALVSRAGEREVSAWQWWGVAAGAMLAWRPLDVFDLGFALSFGSVGGLLALAGPLDRMLHASDRGPAFRWLSAGFVATTAASAGTLVVQSASFGWIAPIGFLVNPIAVPLCGIALPLVWIGLALDAALPEALAAPPASAAAAALGALCLLVSHAAGFAGAWVPGPVGWAGTSLAGLGAAFLLSRRHPGAGALVAGAAIALALASRAPRPPVWEVTWLDVGQGDAIAIRFPDGATWLVDAGRAWSGGDEGRRTVVPWLRRQGVRSLEWLVTTHPDLDHIGGARSVLAAMPVRRWGSGGPVSGSEAYLDLLAGTGGNRLPPAEPLRAGRRLAQGGVSIDVLHPSAEWVPLDPYASRIPSNEGSAVLLLSAGSCRLLLTGDLGEPGERALLATLGDSLRAELLHAGHHGSRHSSSASFLARVRPRIAIVSAGAGNRYGHPHPDALARLQRVGAVVHRTDRLGAITARCTPAGWRVVSEGSYLP
ncbi:MAG: ComEC/Rec2 family competence protein, partial [Gemmatimonadota bacterium]